MRASEKEKLLKSVWDIFENHGIGIIPEQSPGAFMEITVSFRVKGKLEKSVTFSRPAENGMLSWLPEREWHALRDGDLAAIQKK